MKFLKERFKGFVKNEDGMELLQLLIIIGVAAIIAVVVYIIVKAQTNKAEKAANDSFNQLWN